MASWIQKSFEECLEKVTYTAKIQRNNFLTAGTYPIISQEAEFINGYWCSQSDVFKVKNPLVIFGDHTRVLKYIDFNFVLGADGVKILQPKPFLKAKFLFYHLQFKNFSSIGYARHYRLLKQSEVSYPPLPEQQRIVAILDEAFEGIATAKANTEKNLQNARALFDGYLESVFTQRGAGIAERKMNDICAITSTLVDPRKSAFKELVHIGAGNIESQTGNLSGLQTAQDEGLISGKFLFDQSMVLYSKIRPYLMKVARPDFGGLCSADIYPLAPIPNQITRDYLFYLLLSKPLTEYAIQGSARSGMPKVNREHLFDFRVWLPSVTQQRKLAATLDDLHAETQRLESIYQQKRSALDDLKKSLLHQAFTGNL